ncbi:MAG TPA: antitoxin [Mycobacterium sp.]|nr:antitoxin [Mycobacterium sp.]
MAAADRRVQRPWVDRSQLLRDALRCRLTELAADHDVAGYAEHPLTHDETSLANIADCGPTKGWSDQTDARGER